MTNPTNNPIPLETVTWHVTPIYEGGELFGSTEYYPMRRPAFDAARTLLATGIAVAVLVERHTGTECRTVAAFGDRDALTAGGWIEPGVPVYA